MSDVSAGAPGPRGAWRTLARWYYVFRSYLVAFSILALLVPVSLQIFSRYTPLVLTYIWTEEMARFMFIWTIMIGAIIGVRESAHFDCDVWPEMSRRGDAFGRLLGRFGVLVTAFVFIWGGIEFTRFAWKRTVAGHQRLVGDFSRRADVRRYPHRDREKTHDRLGIVGRPGLSGSVRR